MGPERQHQSMVDVVASHDRSIEFASHLLHTGHALGLLEVVLSVAVGILPGVLWSVRHLGPCFAQDELGVVEVRVDIDFARDLADGAIGKHVVGCPRRGSKDSWSSMQTGGGEDDR